MRPIRFKQLLKRFRRDDKATVGLIFSLSFIPMIGLTGAAVDYNRASTVRSELQTALDATALALAKDATSMTMTQASNRAQTVFGANWTARFGARASAVTVSRGVDRYTVTASAVLDNVMMQIVTSPTTTVSGTATSGWGINKMEIALVLDNTGSMGWSNKMQELKRALCGDTFCSNTNPTSGFIREMRDAAVQNDQIRIALVPFDTTVRVPTVVQNAVNGGSAVGDTLAMSGNGYCGANNTNAQRVSWTLPGGGPVSWVRFANRDRDTLTGTYWDAGTGSWQSNACRQPRVTLTAWQGCLWDRDQAGNRDTNPVGVNPTDISTLYPAVNCRADLARMMPLQDVRTQAATLVNALATMQPSGNTNTTIGAAWGVNMLTPGLPISTAAAPEPNLTRYMIFLTDGVNTENRETGNSGAIDARMRLACTDAKARNIIVYTIRVIEGNRDLLRECASGPGNYFEVSNAADLQPVFRTIAGRIGSIRLTN
jgi:Flp pilus assembly protein TadG